MNNVVTLTHAQLPAAFQNRPVSNDDLRSGVAPSFATLSLRGRIWRVKYRGEERPILDQNGQPIATLPMVLLQASPAISKIFYMGAYVEGDDAAPDCFSVNGHTPDPASPNLQAPTCATCPRNIWGSKITPQGTKTKACADSRRLAVVPVGDIENESYGGPMLFRVPPASLKNLMIYADNLDRVGRIPYAAVVTNFSFDFNASYPLATFSTQRMLDDNEAARVVAVLDNPVIERMLLTAADAVIHDPETPAAQGQPGAVATAPLPTPVVQTPVNVMPLRPTPSVHTPPPKPNGAAAPSMAAFGGAALAPGIAPNALAPAVPQQQQVPPQPVWDAATSQWTLPQAPPPKVEPPPPPPQPTPVWNATTSQWELPGPGTPPATPAPVTASPASRRKTRANPTPPPPAEQQAPPAEPAKPTQESVAGPLGNPMNLQQPPQDVDSLINSILNT